MLISYVPPPLANLHVKTSVGQDLYPNDPKWCSIHRLSPTKYRLDMRLYGSYAELSLLCQETERDPRVKIERYTPNPLFPRFSFIILLGDREIKPVQEIEPALPPPAPAPLPGPPKLLPRINWFGNFNWSGYGQVSKNCVLALDSLGLDVRPSPSNVTPTEDWTTINRLASKAERSNAVAIKNLNPNAHAPRHAYNIRYTVWEADMLPPAWVPILNAEDEIWVPSNFCKDVFRNSGVHKPITVITHGVDLRIFTPRGEGRWRDPRFTFLFIGDDLPRKGLDVFLRAFREEFGVDEPIRALLKLHGGHVGQSKNIHVIKGIIPFSDVLSLYRSADCYVMSSRGEGFGMCGLEALACGLDVIYTNWGGQTEFLSKEIAYPVAYELIPVRDMPYDYVPLWGRAKWAEADIVDLKRTMRHVYENREEARQRTRRGLKMVWSGYSWTHVAEKMLERLREIGL